MSILPLNLDSDMLTLPAPRLQAATLEEALQRRCSTRIFLPDSLSLEELSAVLWAAFGVNRPESGGRTAPSARGWQEVLVYAVMAEGAWRYDGQAHRLDLVKAGDLRAATGVQDFVGSAPLNLVYVADFERMHDAREEDRVFLAGVDAGCIAENVYLYCAAAGLATVVRALIDRRNLAQALDLKPTQRIALAQSIGRTGLIQ
ncbi:SagB-type dehydrogenase domain-containing protein [Variovorax sp. HW608]|uniref:nitroreductase family protein n=1 Tax=Variovorax sp. HW608 TaxID=1034889 RepID=UPI0008202049|nr:nitroreductase family protein [Variovorax sp. HW608]SCK28136.1 SagB-type dehydrogenase domain-containing protein [Variovorax sp. HW608]